MERFLMVSQKRWKWEVGKKRRGKIQVGKADAWMTSPSCDFSFNWLPKPYLLFRFDRGQLYSHSHFWWTGSIPCPCTFLWCCRQGTSKQERWNLAPRTSRSCRSVLHLCRMGKCIFACGLPSPHWPPQLLCRHKILCVLHSSQHPSPVERVAGH